MTQTTFSPIYGSNLALDVSGQTHFLRKMTFERITLYAPSTIVSLIALIKGHINIDELSVALIKVQKKHPLTRSKIQFDENDIAWFTDEGVGPIPVREYRRQSGNDWMNTLQLDYREPFNFSTGPLLRVIVVQGENCSDLILFAHHTICDGRSLTLLLRDLLRFLANPVEPINPMDELPVIESDNLPTPLTHTKILRLIARRMNRRWKDYHLKFTQSEYEQIYDQFWEEPNTLIPHSLTPEDTRKLIRWCKNRDLKVHSVICTAFYRAQSEIQPWQKCHKNLFMPLDVRTRLKHKVGEVFGFYATAAIIPIRYKFRKSFEQNAHRFHMKIQNELRRGDPFKTLKFGFLSPTLTDALYFQKFGFIQNPLVQKLSKLIGWNRLTTGMMISNLGKLDIPETYGNLHIERVYAPSVITTRHEKYLGIATINGCINFLMTSRNSIVPENVVSQVCNRAIEILQEAINYATNPKL